MTRRLIIAATIAIGLGAAGAASAIALPVETTQARWACVSVRPADVGYCVNPSLPSLPRP